MTRDDEAAGGDDQADDDRRRAPEPHRTGGRRRRSGTDEHRGQQAPQRSAQRRIAQHRLQILGHRDRVTQNGERPDDVDQIDAENRRSANINVDERLGQVPLAPHEGRTDADRPRSVRTGADHPCAANFDALDDRQDRTEKRAPR